MSAYNVSQSVTQLALMLRDAEDRLAQREATWAQEHADNLRTISQIRTGVDDLASLLGIPGAPSGPQQTIQGNTADAANGQSADQR